MPQRTQINWHAPVKLTYLSRLNKVVRYRPNPQILTKNLPRLQIPCIFTIVGVELPRERVSERSVCHFFFRVRSVSRPPAFLGQTAEFVGGRLEIVVVKLWVLFEE